ncbi:hypothetical protein [Stenotrophomonas sp. CFBP 13718]|uniref:hypothetical protein n=1 Tax=Stenotrophomonas sp. CFBP 13718 TaxID=2775304 RepID=UPI00177E57C6|nr:hypothetical protein [Stenotrophomonas sp. CFBP 13718]MBD8697312.1 hypothetical protein [Stenotrophomonas sp. CFBP 13718]
MNTISTAMAPASAKLRESGIPMPLTERLRLQTGARTPATSEPELDTAAEDALIPLPEPIADPMPELVRAWAKRMFVETMMYGDEEETGIPPLSIDI